MKLPPSALLTLPLLTHLVTLEVLTTNRRNLHVPPAYVHAVLPQHHLRELGWHLQHRLARKLAILEYEAQAIIFDVVALGLDHALHQLIFRDLERQADAPEVRIILAQLLVLVSPHIGNVSVKDRLLLAQLLQQ